jgi:hypothetical protein
VDDRSASRRAGERNGRARNQPLLPYRRVPLVDDVVAEVGGSCTVFHRSTRADRPRAQVLLSSPPFDQVAQSRFQSPQPSPTGMTWLVPVLVHVTGSPICAKP